MGGDSVRVVTRYTLLYNICFSFFWQQSEFFKQLGDSPKKEKEYFAQRISICEVAPLFIG